MPRKAAATAAKQSKTNGKSKTTKSEEVLAKAQESVNMSNNNNSNNDLLGNSIDIGDLNEVDENGVPTAVLNYDLSEWTVDWVEGIGQNGYPYGHVDLKAPDCPEFESFKAAAQAGVAMFYGKGEDRFTALTASSAFASMCKKWYAYIDPTVVIGMNANSEDSAGYVLSTCSGSVEINGKLIDVPVPSEQGLWSLGGDALLGLHPLPKSFTSIAEAKDGKKVKLEEMSPAAAERMKKFWKAHALMSFTKYAWIRIYFRYLTIEYVRKCVFENRFDVQKTNESINTAAFGKREAKHEKRIKAQVAKGITPTGYKGQEMEVSPVFLLSLKDYDGKFGTIANKVELNATTVRTLGGSTFKTAEVRDDDTVRTVTAWFPQDEDDLVEMFETCQYNNRSLVQIK